VCLGTFTFTTVNDAKIALTNPANYIGSNAAGADNTYDNAVAAIPLSLTITTLSTEVFNLSSVFFYPNPSKGIITIKNNGVALETVEVSDINGRVITSMDLKGTTTDKEIDLTATLTLGLYLVTITSKNASTTKKMIIE
jgi:hypothetical protein